MEIKTINILLVEDNSDDVFFLERMLQKDTGTHFRLDAVSNLAAGLSRLQDADIDVILLDLTLPDSKRMETFRAVKAKANGRPIIILSGVDDETLAVNAVHAGAGEGLSG